MAKNHTFRGLNMRPSNTLEEAVKQYGMDFDIELCPATYPHDGETLINPEKRTVKKLNGEYLGTVGLRYTKVPYPIAFSPAESLIGGGARIVGGGCPNRGERAYLVLEAGGSVTLSPGDEIINRFLLLSSHDGTGKIEVRMTPWRPRTGTAITFDASRPLAFKHTRNVNTRVGRAKKVFKRVDDSWREFSTGVQKMVGIDLTESEAKTFIELVLPTTGKETSTRLENMRSEVLTIYRDTGIGTRLPKCRNTLFGVVQAFAEWADIKRNVRKSSKRDEVSAMLDARLVSDGAKKKATAFGLACTLAKSKNMRGALSR